MSDRILNPLPTDRTELHALTGVRVLLALWVILHHLTGARHMLEPAVSALPLAVQTFVRSGYWAVATFFVLSGFVLARGYGSTSWNRRSCTRYAIARFARIYPVYGLSLVVLAPIIYSDLFSAARPPLPAGRAVLLADYGLVLQGWFGNLPVQWNTPAWSLSCELFFYLCFPLLLLPLRNGTWRRSLVVAGVAILLPSILDAAGLPDSCKPVAHLGDFLLGIALAGVYGAVVRWRPGLAGRGYRFYLPAAALAVLLIAAPGLTSKWIGTGTLLRPLNGVLLIGLALGGGLPARWLSTQVAVLLGRASYAMYILHIPLMWWFKRSLLYRWMAPWPTCAALFYIAGVVAVSALVFKVVEEPANRYLRASMTSWLVPARAVEPTGALPVPSEAAASVETRV